MNKHNETIKFGLKRWYFSIAVPLSGIILFLIIPTLDILFIIIAFGYEAFNNGLHIENSKIGILSNGETLAFHLGLFRYFFTFMFLMIVMYSNLFIIKFIDNKIKKILKEK